LSIESWNESATRRGMSRSDLSLVLKVDQGRFKVECEGAQRSQLLGPNPRSASSCVEVDVPLVDRVLERVGDEARDVAVRGGRTEVERVKREMRVFETALLSLVLKVDQGRFKVECEGAQRLPHWREGSARPRIRYCLVRSIGPSSHRTRAQTRGLRLRHPAGEQSGLGESDPACPPTLLAGRVREGESSHRTRAQTRGADVRLASESPNSPTSLSLSHSSSETSIDRRKMHAPRLVWPCVAQAAAPSWRAEWSRRE
jgi:hypothetical protein